MCYIKSTNERKVYYFGTRRKYTCNNFTSTGDVNTMLNTLSQKKCDYIIIAMVKIYNDTFVIHHTFCHDIIYSNNTHS